MKISILTVLAYFVMMSVSYASDVYITQSGANLTANVNQDGQTNKFGDSTTAVTLTGDAQTLDIDQVGSNNTIAASVVGDTQEVTLNQTGTSVTLIGSSNTVTSTHTGAADQDTTLHHTGASSTFSITQDGAYDGTVNMTTVGSGHNVTVTMDD